MKRSYLLFAVLGAAIAAGVAYSQGQSQMNIILDVQARPVIALPDFRGAGGAQGLADVFNRTVYDDIKSADTVQIAAKSFYPTNPPQQQGDLRPSAAPSSTPPRRGAAPAPTPATCNGRCLSDWSADPVKAAYLGFGYLAEQNGQIVAFGNLFNTSVQDVNGAKLFTKLYNGPLTEDGARQIAHQYAADILSQLGVANLAGSKIYYVSERARGVKEIWSMDFDGANQKQLTSFRSISMMPGVSPDNTRLAFTSYTKGQPRIYVMSLETFRYLPFFNPEASMNATPSFTPDGRRILFSSTFSGHSAQIYSANVDGTDIRRVSNSRAIEVEPKVNPKTGADLVFVSGRGGLQQIYKMNMDGADVERLTNGEGEAANPAWNPDGIHIAFKWTKGFAPGNWNLFVMDVASRETVQLTYGAGRNENPTWAPDGRHLVFSSNRGGSNQIYTMLGNGKELRQLTTQGNNYMPVWVKGH